MRSSAAFEITKNSTDFFPIPSKSPKVESTTKPFMHSFLPCPPSYLTAESEPFFIRPCPTPAASVRSLTISAVISVLLSVLPRCMIRGVSVHPRPNPAASIESHPTPSRAARHCRDFRPRSPHGHVVYCIPNSSLCRYRHKKLIRFDRLSILYLEIEIGGRFWIRMHTD